jgi:hypothetical protein
VLYRRSNAKYMNYGTSLTSSAGEIFSMMCSISECRCGAFVISLLVDNYLSVKAPMVSVRKTQFEAQQQSKCVFPCDLTCSRAVICLNSLIYQYVFIRTRVAVCKADLHSYTCMHPTYSKLRFTSNTTSRHMNSRNNRPSVSKWTSNTPAESS